MEGNRDVETGISGEGVGVGEERERTEETGKERKIRQTQHPRDVNMTRGDMQILITVMRYRVT